jgi:NADH dehydrogenase FAD-containing subunit
MPQPSPGRDSVVVLGGGYGGINVAKALDDIADVTLVDPSEAFVHNVASWRALVEPEWLDRIFLPYERLLAHGRFIRDRAVAIDGRRVTLASGDLLEPDYLVLATGSSYPFPAKTEESDVASARSRLRAAHDALLGAGRALIVGAGPAGLELAGEIKAFFPDKHVTIADVSGDILAGPYDQALRDELRRQLDGLGVELRLGSALSELPSAPPATLAPSPSRPLTARSSWLTSGSAPSACGRTANTSTAGRWTTAATDAATSASTSICASSPRPRCSPSAT